jgi:hypothetical protein
VIHSTDRLRQLNEDRRSRFGTPGRTLALLCECGEDDCQRTVLVTTEDYDARRPGRIVHGDHPPLHAPEEGV